MTGFIKLFVTGIVVMLTSLVSSAIQADDLYKVNITSPAEAEFLKTVDIEPVIRIQTGYLVLADSSVVTQMRQFNLAVEFIENNLTVEQLAIDARFDKKNIEKYPLVYEEDNLRIYRVNVRNLLRTKKATGVELMPVRNEHLQITYPTSKHINETALLNGVNMDSLINLIHQDSLESYLYRLEAFQTRLAGTDSNYAARDWLHSKLLEFGYNNVVVEEFEGMQLYDYITVPCYNVYTVKQGSRYPSQQVVIGAHFDAVPDCPGVDDNGSGTAAVLEMARVLKNIETEMTFVFILFDSEESWMWGSYDYAYDAYYRGDDIVYMMNLDMIAHYDNDHMANVYHGPEKGYSELWCRLAARYTDITGYLGGSTASDHLPFQELGYDVSFVQEYNFSTEYHQPSDSTTYINFEYMTRMVKASLATVYTVNRSLAPVTTTDVFDVGDGQSLRVHWTPTDVTDIDYFWLFYNTVPETAPESLLVPLDSTSYVVDGLQEKQNYKFYLLSGSNDGRISIKYNAIIGMPCLYPELPENQQALPLVEGIHLTWNANNRELDFDHYEIFRDRILLPEIIYDTTYADMDPSLGDDFHEYIIVAVDQDGYWSDTTGAVPVQTKAASLNPYKILAINRTSYMYAVSNAARTGDFLRQALQGYQYDYLSDSAYLKKHDNINLLSLIDYGTIVIGAESGADYDDIGQLPQSGGILEDIAYYLSLGGKAIIFGRWGKVTTVVPYLETRNYYPESTYHAPYIDYFHTNSRILPQSFVNTSTLTITTDFIGGHSQMAGYPNLFWDSLATVDHSKPFNISGIPCPSIPQLSSSPTGIIYTYDSRNDSVLTEGRSIGWRYLGGDYEYVFFDIPLSFIDRDSAVIALRRALTDLGNEIFEDGDVDGVPDDVDNCVSDYNPDQHDNELDGVGDVCDSDDDNDGVLDESDNCVFLTNLDQTDSDSDGFGDACDNCPGFDDQSDNDVDNIPDGCDNCPLVSNENQLNSDGDSYGNVCDNCPAVTNQDQADSDGDGVGDVCDQCPGYNDQDDIDNDNIPDVCDNCPAVPNSNQLDSDGDEFGNTCDNCPYAVNVDQGDSDGDDVGDVCDNCPSISNTNQQNSDSDSLGNDCDNCPNVANENQNNSDSDSFGDACDNCPSFSSENNADSDYDGLGNVCDNCSYDYNPGQEDLNQDDIGDACCCVGYTGNTNCSGGEEPDISDITRLIDYLYLTHSPLCCPGEADADGSGGDPDISDITALIDHLYLSHRNLSVCP